MYNPKCIASLVSHFSLQASQYSYLIKSTSPKPKCQVLLAIPIPLSFYWISFFLSRFVFLFADSCKFKISSHSCQNLSDCCIFHYHVSPGFNLHLIYIHIGFVARHMLPLRCHGILFFRSQLSTSMVICCRYKKAKVLTQALVKVRLNQIGTF